MVPSLVAACQQLGAAAGKGGFGTGLVEYESGKVVVAELTADTLLAIFFAPATNVGAHLYELQRHRAAIAELL
jgi:predicted regulator of Ras-like GTPase activity (Roadblock/LC7/MglB family)